MLIACHCEGKGWKFWGDSNLKSKFWGQSIQLEPVGVLTLEFDDGEIFQWSKVGSVSILVKLLRAEISFVLRFHSLLLFQVTTTIHNLILGKLYCNHHGTMNIRGNREYSCSLKFKEQSFLDRSPRQVRLYYSDDQGRNLHRKYVTPEKSESHFMPFKNIVCRKCAIILTRTALFAKTFSIRKGNFSDDSAN